MQSQGRIRALLVFVGFCLLFLVFVFSHFQFTHRVLSWVEILVTHRCMRTRELGRAPPTPRPRNLFCSRTENQ